MNILVLISRIIVGSLFIVSGLVKANDTLGFSYKLEEYFSAAVFDLPALEPMALFFAILVSVGEVALGVAVLVGGKMKLTTWLLVILTVFFGFLTWYSWVFDAVKDCGCFGDALKGSIGRSLTPAESFFKDLILFVFVIPIFLKRHSISLNTMKENLVIIPASLLVVVLLGNWLFGWSFPIIFTIICFGIAIAIQKLMEAKKAETAIAVAVLVFTCGFVYYTFEHLPIIDYRPYAVGKNIPDGMKTCDELGLPCPEYGYIYTLVHQQTQEVKEMDNNEYMTSKIWEDKNWVMDSEKTKQVVFKEGHEPTVHDFVINTLEGEDITNTVLSDKGYTLLMLSKNLAEVGEYGTTEINGVNQTSVALSNDTKALFEKVDEFAEKGPSVNAKVIAWASSTMDEIETMKHTVQSKYDWTTGDQITIKTVVRSNPGFVLLKEGTVVGKWHRNDFPVSKRLSKS